MGSAGNGGSLHQIIFRGATAEALVSCQTSPYFHIARNLKRNQGDPILTKT
jgi:hypothetical protein